MLLEGKYLMIVVANPFSLVIVSMIDINRIFKKETNVLYIPSKLQNTLSSFKTWLHEM